MYVCMCICVSVCGSVSGWTVGKTHNEEPLPLPVFIHADDLVRRRQFASWESAESFWLLFIFLQFKYCWISQIMKCLVTGVWCCSVSSRICWGLTVHCVQTLSVWTGVTRGTVMSPALALAVRKMSTFSQISQTTTMMLLPVETLRWAMMALAETGGKNLGWLVVWHLMALSTQIISLTYWRFANKESFWPVTWQVLTVKMEQLRNGTRDRIMPHSQSSQSGRSVHHKAALVYTTKRP